MLKMYHLLIQLYTWQAQWIIPVDCIPPAKQRKWALSQIGKLWRGHKAELKENYCKPGIPREALLELSSLEVDDNQFHVLVEYWFSQKGMIVIVAVVLMFFFYRFRAQECYIGFFAFFLKKIQHFASFFKLIREMSLF